MTLVLERPQPLRLIARADAGLQAGLDVLEDAALVGLARHGREVATKDAAFDELVRRHAPRLHAVASRIVGREEAFDVVQDGFLAAYRALSGFRQEAQFTTWLHRIVLNCCYARLRKADHGQTDLEMPLEASDQGPSPVELAEQSDLRAALERALAKIKPEFRETFVLVEFGDLDYAQVAEVLNVQVGTIKSRMSRAREALRAILEAEGYRP